MKHLRVLLKTMRSLLIGMMQKYPGDVRTCSPGTPGLVWVLVEGGQEYGGGSGKKSGQECRGGMIRVLGTRRQSGVNCEVTEGSGGRPTSRLCQGPAQEGPCVGRRESVRLWGCGKTSALVCCPDCSPACPQEGGRGKERAIRTSSWFFAGSSGHRRAAGEAEVAD